MKQYIELDTLIAHSKDLRFLSSEQLTVKFKDLPTADVLDRHDLIDRIRYSSAWNEPCPEWVYRLIENS